MAMLRRLSSRFDKDSTNSESNADIRFATWQQLLDYLMIDPVEIPWNANGAETLDILRRNYGTRFPALNDSKFDETARRFDGRSIDEQTDALGSAAQNFNLVVCRIRLEEDREDLYYLYIDTKERIDEITTRREPLSLYHTIQRLISIASLNCDVSLDNPPVDMRLPVSMIMVGAEKWENFTKLGHFLIVFYHTVETSHPEKQERVRVYDLRYWPIRELKHELSYNRNNIMPYTLTIESDCGEKYCFVGEEISKFMNEAEETEDGGYIPKGEYCPTCDGRQKKYYHGELIDLPKIGKSSIMDLNHIPSIGHAEPMMIVDNSVIYEYMYPGEPQDTLIEYNLGTKKFRKMELTGFKDVRNMIVYKNKWIVLFSSRIRRSSSYAFRLWNPRTNECLRVINKDLGDNYNEISDIISTPNGDIMVLLTDGRLCHLDVDLVAWLKEDMQIHDVPLSPWQEEVRRAYENFPALQGLAKADDRMLITFEDGKTYDVMIRENK